MTKKSLLASVAVLVAVMSGCAGPDSGQAMVQEEVVQAVAEAPEYFLLRPEVEKAYGYSHAVKVGHHLKISGAVSMDDQGNPTAVGDLEQQMKNAYDDLEKVLDHDVIVEDVFTTDMAKFLEVAGYRSAIYTKQFPTGTWLEVKGLALPEFLIEIELEAHR
jgi:2-iminobutanoate/2-iminopropanoate deaminase